MKLKLSFLLLAGLSLGSVGCTTNLRDFDPYAETVITGDEPAVDPSEFADIEPAVAFDRAWLRPSQEAFRLGPGDQVAIELIGEAGSFNSTFVTPDGMLYFHLAPGVDVWGLTVPEAEAAVAEELSEFFRNPQVVITLERVVSRKVSVLGRLGTPGVYPLERPTTILEAISMAGGLFTSRFTGTTEELADLHHSFILRNGQPLPIDFQELVRGGDTLQNIYLQPDDYIYIPSSLSQEVYIMGAVGQPRAVGFKDQLTIIQAIAQAKGTLPGAYLKEVVLVRGSLTSPKTALINVQDILEGQMPNLKLEPRDIIYVPRAPQSGLKRYARLAVDTFVRTLAANEGNVAGGGRGDLPVNLSVGGGQ